MKQVATISKRRIALKGQSRSRFCAEPVKARSKTLCARLTGHNGKHRATTFRSSTADKVVVAAEAPKAVEPTVEQQFVEVPMAEYQRLVAAQRERSARRGSRYHASSKPSARLA
jgi:hypothetical protein